MYALTHAYLFHVACRVDVDIRDVLAHMCCATIRAITVLLCCATCCGVIVVVIS